jgi:cell wall-associated NlpC family hydrolase
VSAPTTTPTRKDAATVVAVLLALGFVAAMVAVAMNVRPHGTPSSTVVFTQAAPYNPGTSEPVPPMVTQPSPAPAAQIKIGQWTPEIGVEIANRALSWLNWPYSYGAGDAQGPTFGVPVDYDSRNDGHVRGFDCSGLVLFAMAPWRTLVHDAATQYTESGSVHPALNSLEPGDLLFWSKDGTINGIGHVAIYVGNGDVVEAPYSGAYIEVVPIDKVESGRIGATRPLT